MLERTTISFRTIVITASIFLVAVATASVLLFQARYLIIGPRITLETDISGTQNTRQVTLTGNARNISRLWLNDRQIFTDPSGTFSEPLVLANGHSIVTLRATDRYGRTTTVEQSVVYVPASFY